MFVILIVPGLCKIKGLAVHPQLSRARVAPNNADQNPDDSDSDDDDYVYVLNDADDE